MNSSDGTVFGELGYMLSCYSTKKKLFNLPNEWLYSACRLDIHGSPFRNHSTFLVGINEFMKFIDEFNILKSVRVMLAFFYSPNTRFNNNLHLQVFTQRGFVHLKCG